MKVLSFNFIKGQKVDFLLRAGETPGPASVDRSAVLRTVARLVLRDVREPVPRVLLAGVGRAGGEVGAAHCGRVYPGVSRGRVLPGPDPLLSSLLRTLLLLACLLSWLLSSRLLRLPRVFGRQGRTLPRSWLTGAGWGRGVEDQTWEQGVVRFPSHKIKGRIKGFGRYLPFLG